MKTEEGFRQNQRVSWAEVQIGAEDTKIAAGGGGDCREQTQKVTSAACIGQIAKSARLSQRAAGVPQQSANLPQTSAADCRSNVFAAVCLPQTAADCRSMNLYFMCPRSTAAFESRVEHLRNCRSVRQRQCCGKIPLPEMKQLLKLRACPQDNVQYAAMQSILSICARSLLEFEYLPFVTVKCGNQSNPVLWLARALDTLPSGSSIRTITIYLDFHVHGGTITHKEDWATLDTSLMRPELRAANVTIFPFSTFYASRDNHFIGGRRMLINDTRTLFDSLRFADL
ncbi:hypothetical protein FB451DRAFT_1447211 [Mycena latifolia]|nr:hypothetical protein FB451DRAFT_1447211 [Mycena latifolia]